MINVINIELVTDESMFDVMEFENNSNSFIDAKLILNLFFVWVNRSVQS